MWAAPNEKWPVNIVEKMPKISTAMRLRQLISSRLIQFFLVPAMNSVLKSIQNLFISNVFVFIVLFFEIFFDELLVAVYCVEEGFDVDLAAFSGGVRSYLYASARNEFAVE